MPEMEHKRSGAGGSGSDSELNKRTPEGGRLSGGFLCCTNFTRPTGALNKANSEEVMRLLMELNHDGQSILMVTHDVRAALYGNRILYLEDGKILDECTLSPYGQDDLKNRESKVMGWLSGLGW